MILGPYVCVPLLGTGLPLEWLGPYLCGLGTSHALLNLPMLSITVKHVANLKFKKNSQVRAGVRIHFYCLDGMRQTTVMYEFKIFFIGL